MGLALLGPLFLMLVSNLAGVVELLAANGFSGEWLYRAVAIAGLPGPKPSPEWYPTEHWWWWRVSRLGSGWNVQEFPFWSFLLGDLHAHVLVLPYALLMLGAILNLWRLGSGADLSPGPPSVALRAAARERDDALARRSGGRAGAVPDAGERALDRWIARLPHTVRRVLRSDERAGERLDGWFALRHPWLALGTALIAGSLYVTNAWDFPTALVLLGLVTLASGYAGVRRATLWPVVRGATFLLPVAVLAVLLYLPFYLGFTATPTRVLLTAVPSPAGIERHAVTTPPVQFFIWWGPLLFPVVSYLALRLVRLRPWRLDPALVLLAVAVGVLPLLIWLAGQAGVGGAGEPLEQIRARGHLVLTWPLMIALVILAALVLLGEVFRPEGEVPLTVPVFLAAGMLMAFLLILFPEFFFIEDLAVLSRHNTVFKFYYTAWLLLAVCGAAGAACVLTGVGDEPAAASPRTERRSVAFGRLAWGGVGLVVLGAALVYPVIGSLAKSDGFAGEPSLNGLTGLRQSQPEEYEAARWLVENIEGMPVVLEAHGPAYSPGGRVSGRTGIPTLIGWTNHEWQQRGALEPVEARIREVETLYTTDDAALARRLLDRYGIRYVYIGDYERQRYGPGAAATLKRLGRLVYQNATVEIYAVGPAVGDPPASTRARP